MFPSFAFSVTSCACLKNSILIIAIRNGRTITADLLCLNLLVNWHFPLKEIFYDLFSFLLGFRNNVLLCFTKNKVRIYSVNVTEFISRGCNHIYWKKPLIKNLICCAVTKFPFAEKICIKIYWSYRL